MMMKPSVTRGLAAAAVVALCAGFATGARVDVSGVGEAQAAVAEAFDAEHFTGLGIGQPVVLRGVPVGDRRVDLELERFDVATPDAAFMIDDREVDAPGVVLLRGKVAGEDGSLVVLGVGTHATNGLIRTGGKVFSVSTGAVTGAPVGSDKVRIADMAGFRFEDLAPACGLNDATLFDLAPAGVPAEARPRDGSAPRGEPPCRVVRVAIDTDWEWTQELFAGDAEAGAEYALFLVAAISEVYQRDVNVRLAVPFLRTFSGNFDPYTGGTSPDPLDQVLEHWRAHMGHVDRELVHLLTGANTSYGGIAYVGVLCNDDYGFGVSSYMDGSFPYPLQMNSYSNWDLVVMSHELGHNFGTLHTHDYSPPIDRCGIDCTGDLNGTIMSYCHICSGGLINVDLRFHSRVQTVIEDYMQFDVPCNLQPGNGANDDSAVTYSGVPVDILVLANDERPDCEPAGLAGVQSPTPGGGTAEIAGWDNPTGDPTGRFVRYTPAAGFSGTDTFTYTNSFGQTGTVSVEVETLRPADAVANPEDGLLASYYAIPSVSSMPDVSGLDPVEVGVANSLAWFSTNGNAVGGPLADNVAAVFEGYVIAPESGLYTFSLESDDGSLLYIGDELVVDNDGLHGMVSASGQIALEAGPHEARVEFFEATGGAGLIFRWGGPGASGLVPASALVHEAQSCGLADLAEPYGVLDLEDIGAFVTAFGAQDDAADLAAPFGVWDLADLGAFVGAFTAGCP